MASINDLDNPLLVLILNRLCIQKLFTAGHVCVRWNELRVTSARSRKQLILLIGSDAQRCIDDLGFEIFQRRFLVDENGDVMFPENDQSHAQLQVYSFPQKISHFLCAHFDHLTSLTISTCLDLQEINSIAHLLKQFNRPNGTLHTLKLYSNYYDNEISTEFRRKWPYIRLLKAINSIGSLRKLVFDENGIFGRDSESFRLDLPILLQLEEFEFNSGDRFVCLFDSITKYAVNNQGLRRIGIRNPISNPCTCKWLLALSTELSSRFTHLHFGFGSYNNFGVYYENLCRHFSHLTSLKISYYQRNITIIRLFRPLIHLTNLLSLMVKTEDIIVNRSFVPPNERGIMHFELPSVKVFTINITFSGSSLGSHNFLHQCNLIRLFPNVQVVQVIRQHSLCCVCDKKIASGINSDVIALEEHCARHAFRHLTHCRDLRIVCSNIAGVNVRLHGKISYRQWLWSEMEPFEEEGEEGGDDEDEEENEEEEMEEEEVPENIQKGTSDDPIQIDETSEEEDDDEEEN